MDLRYSSITADILHILLDCKIHTMPEIAIKIEVSRMTVVRHIESLSYRYPIQTFCGGAKKGGVFIDANHIYKGKILTIDELQLINKSLKLLQKFEKDYVNKQLINS